MGPIYKPISNLRYSASNVIVSLSTEGGSETPQGTYSLTSPLIVQGLLANDSVLIYGTASDDTFLVGGGQHTINGAGLVVEGPALMTLIGAAGNDVYQFDADSQLGSWVIEDSAGIDHLDFSQTTSSGVSIILYDTVAQTVNPNLSLRLEPESSIENGTGTPLDDIIFGNSFDNTLSGLDGIDHIAGYGGNDSLIGGLGNDRYRMHAAIKPETDSLIEQENGGIDQIYFWFLNTPVSINLGLTTPQVTDENRTIILNSSLNFEDVVGGQSNDTLIGNEAANSLYGSSGNDTINGMGGDDSLSGLNGSDVFVFSPATTPEFDVLSDFGTSADTDFLAFGLITSNITVNLGLTTVQAVHTNRTLKLNSSTRVQGVAGGTGNDTLTGNNLDNTMLGNGGNDTLRGQGGNDHLFGGTGDDVYIFSTTSNAENDQVTEQDSQGTDTLNFVSLATPISINLGTTAVQPVHSNRSLKLNSATNFENIVGGSGDDTLTGNFANNTLTGSAGSDVLRGQAGSDSLFGGPGDDVYVFSPTTTAEADQITEGTNAGTDSLDFASLTTAVTLNLGTAVVQTVHANRTLKLNSGSNVENASGGSASDTLRGNAVSNVLVGNAGDDVLVGLGGRDILIGGTGFNTINGGADDDILIAGTTSYDALFSRLNDLRTAWLSTDVYATRVTALKAGVGAANASIQPGVTVFNDTGRDRLIGGTESDWFLRALDDVIVDLVGGELVDLL